MPGVYRDGKRGAWRAVITNGKRTLSRYFSIARHGDDGARALAEGARLRMLVDLENGRDPALRSPAAKSLARR